MSSFNCDQIWADWDFAAEEAARAQIASDFLATVAQAVRMAGGAAALSQESLDVEPQARMRPLDEAVKSFLVQAIFLKLSSSRIIYLSAGLPEGTLPWIMLGTPRQTLWQGILQVGMAIKMILLPE